MSYAGQLLLVVLPAIVGAFGTIVSVVVAMRLKDVQRSTNGALERIRARADEAHELAATAVTRQRPTDSASHRD